MKMSLTEQQKVGEDVSVARYSTFPKLNLDLRFSYRILKKQAVLS